MGWTGIQYSVFRAGLAVAVAHVCLVRLPLVEGPAWPLLLLGLPASLALAIGWRDRALAGNLVLLVAGLAAFVDGAPLVLPGPDILFTASLLVLHMLVPITPFGSWDARDRIDPRGEWQRPAWIGHAAWLWLSMIHLDRAFIHWGDAARTVAELDFVGLSIVMAVLELAFVVGLFITAVRPAAWIALTLWQIAWIAAFGAESGEGALLLLHAFAVDPGWWPGRRLRPLVGPPEVPARLFYDGDCGFCHRSVRFVLSEEAGTPVSLKLRFAPLASETFATQVVARDDVDPTTLPDSIVLTLEDGQLLTRSAAALEIASRLGGFWRLVAVVGSVFPTPLLDRAYDGVARIRKRLFVQPKDACPILPMDLRARFDP